MLCEHGHARFHIFSLPRCRQSASPHDAHLAFVVANGRTPSELHIYTARSGHQAMTLSVAAGTGDVDGLGQGVAPAARVLLVRTHGADFRLSDLLEGYLDAIKRSDVDILCDSAGLTIVPDTGRDFAGLFLSRLVAEYRKPIFHSAGNSLLLLNGVSSLGEVFSVGGSISAAEFSTFYGGATIPLVGVHPLSVGGPSLDGAIKPDFLAPVHRVAADVFANDASIELPRNAPATSLPRGYAISCCTSASSPYAAGAAALLMSAAKQRGIDCSIEALGRALRIGARFLSGWPAYQQGNGVLDVNTAWRELQRHTDVPRILVTTGSVHALAGYAASSGQGVGLFERSGWKAGDRGQRLLQLRRESGSAAPIAYRLSWSGNDGTFDTASDITLPLKQTVTLALTISIESPGVHAALLNLHDPESDAIVLRIGATIVAPEQVSDSHAIRFAGAVPIMMTRSHYLTVPERAGAIWVELEVLHGSIGVVILPSHGLLREYYGHVFPQAGRTFTTGRYSVLLPRPAPGTWSITIINDSIWRESNQALVSSKEAAYNVSARFLTAAVSVIGSSSERVVLNVSNEAAALEDASLELSLGNLRSHIAEFSANGLPVRFEIDVPPNAGMLAVRARAADDLELYLYDCSSGECFSYDFTVPAVKEHTFVVRKPAAGRWVAAVNPAPLPTRRGVFTFDEILTDDRLPLITRLDLRLTAARSVAPIDIPAGWRIDGAATRVAVAEVFDLALEEEAREHPWETREGLPNLANVRVATGMTIVRLK